MANDPSKTLEEIEDGHEENVAHDQDLLDEAAHDGGATDDTAGTSQELMKRKKKKAHRRPTLNEIAKCCDKAAEEDIEKIRQLDRESAELTTERARRVAHLKKRALHHEAEAAFARTLNKQACNPPSIETQPAQTSAQIPCFRCRCGRCRGRHRLCAHDSVWPAATFGRRRRRTALLRWQQQL
eukprot:TRINITY_DN4970_c0_g1_i1.p1 TRINITY_DN4970_c0_g1~~TRINITY_DN4970_c0_g1_i1.p1  ORF type:complete len:183 (+),score=32.69 TRINITY_DN4970_c0_g1_i1:117-665(+)